MRLATLLLGLVLTKMAAGQIDPKNNFCDKPGTQCTNCQEIKGDGLSPDAYSCLRCWGNMLATKVPDFTTDVRQCTPGPVSNCAFLGSTPDKCRLCNPGYALDDDTQLCVPESTKIIDCAFLVKKDGQVTCDMCMNSRIASEGGKSCNGIGKDVSCFAYFSGGQCAFCRLGGAKANQSYTCGYPGPFGCEEYYTPSNCTRCNYLAGYFAVSNIFSDHSVDFKCKFKRRPIPRPIILEKLFQTFQVPDKEYAKHRNSEFIYSEFTKANLSLDSQIAYALALAKVYKDLIPYKEELAPVGTEKRAEQEVYYYDGFYGRGYVQFTGRANYQKMSNLLQVEMAYVPDYALDPYIAARILREVATNGFFNTQKLTDFVNDKKKDFLGAGRVFGLDATASIDVAETAQRILDTVLVFAEQI